LNIFNAEKLVGGHVKKISLNKAVKFHIKIPNGCWENGEKL